MGDVRVAHSEDMAENAILLLGAADELDMDPSVVRTQSDGHYLVPQEVADKAGLEYETDEEPVVEPEPDKKATAKKATAKKTKG